MNTCLYKIKNNFPTISLHINKKKCFEIGNRAIAIRTAIQNSSPNEIILIAGKGHEDVQDYGVKKFKISDFDIIKKIQTKNQKLKLQKR